jgi:hypothetical protein
MTSYAHLDYGTPKNEPLPEKIKNLRQASDVLHFPKEIDPIKIEDTYYWKHLTSIMCKDSQIEIIEFGAYIYYNDSWNLRREYPITELNKTFGSKNQLMNQAEPCTWANNYRTGTQLYGGLVLYWQNIYRRNRVWLCDFEYYKQRIKLTIRKIKF